MTDLPRKITDDPYGAAILIRRLVAEQAITYWRRYLLAFVLMAVAAGATAGSAYILGQVINQAYIDKNVPAIARLSGVVVLLLFIKGVATYGHTVILSKISNAILANNQRRLFAKLMSESLGFFSERHSSEFLTRLTAGAKSVTAGPQPADQCRRTRSAAADRPGRRHGDAGSGYVAVRACWWRRRRCWCCASW